MLRALTAAAAGVVLLAMHPHPAASRAQGGVVIGHSVRGRAIVAYELGDTSAPATLVVGVIHGNEPAGLNVIWRLRKAPLPPGVHLWLIPTVNPDGLAAGTRQNAHGVDLNRNWPTAWVLNGRPWDGYYSGPRPMSEPENRAVRAFIQRIKPGLTIWYHQPLALVYGSDPHVAVLKHYARLTGLPYRRLAAPAGAATRWQRLHYPRSPAFVVEFAAGPLSAASIRRHASAVLALAPRGATKAPASRQGGAPVALVTAETQDQLIAVSLPSGRILRRLHMPDDPQNVECGPRSAVVVSTRGGAVTIVDAFTLRIRRVIRGFAAPHIAALSPGGKYAYVTDDARGQLVQISLPRGRVLRRLFVGFGAHHIAVSPGGRQLWIALGERARSITIVDTTRMRVVGHVVPDGDAHDLAFSPGGERVWVTHDDRSTITLYDATTRRPVTTLSVGRPPQHVAFSEFELNNSNPQHFAYVTSGYDGTMRVFYAESHRLVRTIAVPYGSFNASSRLGLVTTASLLRGTLTELEAAPPFKRLETLTVASAARDVALAVLP